jgi:hypothetical protein
MIKAQQTWIKSGASREMPIGNNTDAYFIIPNSESGVFLYYPIDLIIDSIILTGDANLTFSEGR